MNSPYHAKQIFNMVLLFILFNLKATYAASNVTANSQEVTPETPSFFTVQAINDTYQMEWSVVNNATHYELYHLIDEQWVSVNNNIISNFHNMNLILEPNFRISACNQYGCSSPKQVNNYITKDLNIRAFQLSSYSIESNQTSVLSWNIVGASRVKLTSSKGLEYDYLPLQGSMHVTTDDMTEFTIDAIQFEVTNETQTLNLIKQISPVTSQLIPIISSYLQPLLNLNLDPIERSILNSSQGISYVADLQQQLHKITDNGEILWTRQLDGLIANKPLILDDHLYFSVSSLNGIGQVCKLTLFNENYICQQTKYSAVASPIVYQQSGTFSDSTRLFQMDMKGLLYEYNTVDFSVINNELDITNGAITDTVLTTPTVHNESGQFTVRSQNNTIITVNFPDEPTLVNSFTRSFSSFFSYQSQAVEPKNSSVVWSKKLD